MTMKAMAMNANREKQRGAALAISLILMVAMTILGVATLNGSRLAEKVSSNAQQKTIAFEAAESAINSVHSAPDVFARLKFARTSSPNFAPVSQVLESNQYGTELDQSNSLGTTVDLSTVATIQFCGEYIGEGTEFNADEGAAEPPIGYAHDIRAVSSIANSKAQSDNVLRAGDSGPKLGNTGTCVTPGT